MKDYVKVAGQVALGIVAGTVLSKVTDGAVEKVKKAVKEKKEKSHN